MVVVLTRRETQVLVRRSAGWTAGHSGRRLGISTRTVESHIANVYRKARAAAS